MATPFALNNQFIGKTITKKIIAELIDTKNNKPHVVMNLSNTYFHGDLGLSELDLSGYVLNGAGLSYIHARSEVIDLTVTNADLVGANFSNSKINCLKISNSVVTSTLFNEAVLPDGCFDGIGGLDTVFNEARLTYGSFNTVTLEFPLFIEANLKGSVFTNGYILRGDFLKAKIDCMKMIGIKVDNSQWVGVVGDKAEFENVDLSSSDFSGATLTIPTFTNSDLSHSWFVGGTLISPTFNSCNLKGVDFSGCTITSGDFKGSDMTGALLGDAIFLDTDLTADCFKGADFTKRENNSQSVPS